MQVVRGQMTEYRVFLIQLQGLVGRIHQKLQCVLVSCNVLQCLLQCVVLCCRVCCNEVLGCNYRAWLVEYIKKKSCFR